MIINVTKPYLPDLDDYNAYLKMIWDNNWLTNRGPLVVELERRLRDYLGVDSLLFVSNGTVALQLCLKVLNIKGEVITTPFSYVATTTSLLWENCKPVFADIEDQTFCIDPDKIEKQITERTTAIMATHVYGYPCDTERIAKIAKKYNLSVIYDAAHAFGVEHMGQSILNFGDFATLSFHATKVFHTGEGGGVVCNDRQLNQKLFRYHTFGHEGDEYYSIGINGKNSELHAAMGLCNIKNIDSIIRNRQKVSEEYDQAINWNRLRKPETRFKIKYNYAYYPVIFEDEQTMLRTKKVLIENQINTRRYFYPSLNQLPYQPKEFHCPVSEDIALRVLALPMYHDLSNESIIRIANIINFALRH